MNFPSRLALCSLIVAGPLSSLPTFAAPAVAPAKTSLQPGAPAPAFKAGRWVKGTPVHAFQKGQVYVVEFWATWCGPCKVTIPHLTELAKEYQGKVTFIGVDIMESGHGADPAKADEKVDTFVARMGATMEYGVCRDRPDGYLEKNFFKPGNFGGIPACVVVDGKGTIAWTGHPMSLASVLPEVLTAGFNAKTFGVAFARQEEALKAIGQAVRSQEWTKAVALAEAYQPLKHDTSHYKELYLFQAQLHVDSLKAGETFAKLKTQADLVPYLAQIITEEKGLDKAWYERAVAIAEPLAQESKDDLSLLARAYYRNGEKGRAIDAQKAYIAWLKTESAKEPDKAQSYDFQIREARTDLLEYQD